MKSTLAHRTERVPEQPEKAVQGRLLCRPEPNAGKRRTAGSGKSQEKEQQSEKIPQRQIRKNEIFTYLEVQGTLPCREIFKRKAAS